jgi:hypothetical protein
MLPEDIAASSSGKSVEVPSTVLGDCVIGGGQHMNYGHGLNVLSVRDPYDVTDTALEPMVVYLLAADKWNRHFGAR